MNKTRVHILFAALLVVAQFTMEGCSLLGLAAGSVADGGKRDTVSVFNDINGHIGTVVRVTYIDSAVAYGFATLKGYHREPDSLYRRRYQAFRSTDSSGFALALNEPIRIFGTQGAGEPSVAAFGGYMPDAIAVNGHDSVRYDRIDHVEQIATHSSISGEEMQWMVWNNRVPVNAVLEFEDDSGRFSMVNNQFNRVEALTPNHKYRDMLSGTGLAVDLSILVALITTNTSQ
ncbi:MAG: hypothetical protein JSS75_02825 [Bacteroidetes bacterium]|nr:hypothetical protein [Bacteroidota bacterium]